MQPGRVKSSVDVPLPALLEIHPVQPTAEPLCLTSWRVNSNVLRVVAKPRLFCLPSTLGLDRAFSALASSVPQLLGLLEPEWEAGSSLALISLTFGWMREVQQSSARWNRRGGM